MKIYCIVWINDLTGEIHDCATCPTRHPDRPGNQIDIEVVDKVTKTARFNLTKRYIEFNSSGYIRGGELKESFELPGRNPTEKLTPGNRLKIKPGKDVSRFNSLKETKNSKGDM